MFSNMGVHFVELADSDVSHVVPFCAQDSPHSPPASVLLPPPSPCLLLGWDVLRGSPVFESPLITQCLSMPIRRSPACDSGCERGFRFWVVWSHL